jgi:hypothetical protein
VLCTVFRCYHNERLDGLLNLLGDCGLDVVPLAVRGEFAASHSDGGEDVRVFYLLLAGCNA